MKIEIELPDGYELDKDNSTPTNIVFKKINNWRDKLVQPEKEYHWFLRSNWVNTLEIVEDYKTKRKPEHSFETKEQGELVKEKMLLMQEMLAFAHVMNDGWFPYITDSSKAWGIRIYKANNIAVESFTTLNTFVFGVMVKSKEIAEQMLSEFGDRITKYYNQQY